MLEILTPMNKVERVSRKVDSSTFVAAPGIWGAINSTGNIINVATGVNSLLNKLVLTSASSNVYESHDVSVGRITTMESHGIRIKVDSEGYTATTPVVGDMLVISSATGTEGKLIPSDEAANGTYEIVARIEEVNAAGGWIIYRTISPISVTV